MIKPGTYLYAKEHNHVIEINVCFSELSDVSLTLLTNQLLNDKIAQRGLRKMGYDIAGSRKDAALPPKSTLLKYAYCRFGGLDFDGEPFSSIKAKPTYTHDCELRETCDGAPFLCQNTLKQYGFNQTSLPVIDLLAKGYSHKEIADKMGVSDNAIKKTVARYRRLLGKRSSFELVRYAIKRGLSKMLNF